MVGVVSSVSSYLDKRAFDLNRGENVITLTYPKLPLLVGAYHFNISLYGPEDVDFYYRKSGCASFRVVGPPIDSMGRGFAGIMQLDHGWNIDA